MRLALFAAGFTTTIGQVVLMRELVATFYGNELLFGLALMAWLGWVALGSWGGSRWAMRRELGAGAFAAGLALGGILLPVQVAVIRGGRALLGVVPGAFVEFGPMVAVVLLVLAPLCLLGGFLFTLGVRLLVERGGLPGQAYAWESAGAVAGGALFSFALVHWLDAFQVGLSLLGVDLAVAAYVWLAVRPRLAAPSRALSLAAPLALLALGLAGALPLGSTIDERTLRAQLDGLVFSADSPYGRLSIQARDGQRVFFQNGLLAFETQGTFAEGVVHFPLLAHPDPRRVLLVGGGVAGDLREALKHPIDRLTYVELDPLLIEAAKAHLPPEDAAVLHDPRLETVLSDGRLFIKTTLDSFDVVILDLPEPATGSLNRFYTQEFFAEVDAVLDPGGVFALGLPSAENYLSPELARRNASVYHTLKAVFAQVVVLPGEHNFFLASHAALVGGPTALAAQLAARLEGRGIQTRWVTPAYIDYLFTTDRFERLRGELEGNAGVRLNRDLTPICYYYDLALWMSLFYPNLRGAFERASLVTLGWLALPLAALALAARWRRGWAVPVAIGAIGFVEMTLEMVILFSFQVLHGYVYAELSLIVAAFMGGLALGSAASNRLLGVWGSTSNVRVKRLLVAVQAGVVLYSGVFFLLVQRPLPAPELLYPLLALLAGGLTGMAFPLAVALRGGRPSRAAGLLYGVDLLGGCLGALLSAALFVPLLGIPGTLAVTALAALAGLLALVG